MDALYAEIVNRLNTGMPYLLLGQNFWKGITDKLYDSISDGLGIKEYEGANIYLNIDDSTRNVDTALQFIQTEADCAFIPSYAKMLSKVYWNGVITSAVEDFTEKAFRIELKNVQPVYQFSPNLPYDYKSKRNLHISYLYGCINQIDKGFRPPLSLFDKVTANAKVEVLFDRLNKEFLTPMGFIVIDGYDYNTDWLSDESLYRLCGKLSKGQVYMFGCSDEVKKNQYIKRLVDDGIVILIKESIIDFIEKIQDELIEDNNEFLPGDVVVSIDNKPKEVPRRLYKKLSRFCQVLDDFTFFFDLDKNEVDQLDLFREFLYRASLEPVWSAYSHKMNIVRDYEEEAYDAIDLCVKNDSLSTKPIIIYGQTGTGKSVTLASLAYRLKNTKKHPIIYIDGRTDSIDNYAIEEFCDWCNGAKVAIFWDATTHGNDISKYNELNNYLASKGKKAVIIGTSYNVSEDIKNKNYATYIEAPVKITSLNELEAFKIKYEEMTGRRLEDDWSQELDNSFLAALYRLLPNTKYNIRRGLIGELSVDSVQLSDLITMHESNTPMAELLKQCKCYLPSETEQKENNKISVQKIIKIVAVIGQYGIAIPFDIVYRMLSGEISYLVGSLLDRIDFLHVESDYLGNIRIFPRNSLEAKIISGSTMISLSERAQLILEVISSVTSKELTFLVELLKAIGPNGSSEYDEYKDYYCDIAGELSRLRQIHGVYNEGTILQETSYIREYFKNSSNKDFDIKLLRDAQYLLKKEIDAQGNEAGYSSRAKNYYGQLLIELAANLGAEIKYVCDVEKKSYSVVIGLVREQEQYIEKAMVYSPDPYYPVDIFAWTTDIVINYQVSEDDVNELKTKRNDLFDRVCTFNPEIIHRDDYNKRLVLINDTDNKEITNEAFDRLLSNKSDAGIYIRATNQLEGISFTGKITDDEAKRIYDVIGYLEKQEFNEVLQNSRKLLFLDFKLHWFFKVKEPIFAEEKKVLPFTRKEWEKLYSILLNIESLSDEISPQIRLLCSVCCFHMGEEAHGLNQLDGIRNNYYLGNKRPVISFIASNPERVNSPRDFRGQLQEVEPVKGRAKFYIPELRRNVFYYNRDFVAKSPETGVDYDGLHLGFSYMGVRISDIKAGN